MMENFPRYDGPSLWLITAQPEQRTELSNQSHPSCLLGSDCNFWQVWESVSWFHLLQRTSRIGDQQLLWWAPVAHSICICGMSIPAERCSKDLTTFVLATSKIWYFKIVKSGWVWDLLSIPFDVQGNWMHFERLVGFARNIVLSILFWTKLEFSTLKITSSLLICVFVLIQKEKKNHANKHTKRITNQINTRTEKNPKYQQQKHLPPQNSKKKITINNKKSQQPETPAGLVPSFFLVI